MKPYAIQLLFIILLNLKVTSGSVFISSAPQNLENATDSFIGILVIVSVIGFYVLGIIVLLMSLGFASKEAKGQMFDTLEKNAAAGVRPPGFGRFKRSSPITHAERYLDLAFMVDTHSCLSKLLCELEIDTELKNGSEEKLLLKIFRESYFNSTSSSTKTSCRMTTLKKVMELGRKTKNKNICLQTFVKCPFNYQQLWNLWKLTILIRKLFAY